MDGIRLLLDNKIFVSIRLNMDSYNEKELYELTEYLANHFAENKYFEVNNSLIYENVGFTPISRSDAQRNLLESKYFALCDYQEKLGISRNRLLTTSIRTNRCSADSLNSVQILPGGEFGNCEHYPDDYFYGSVFNKEPRQLWTDYAERLDICNGCANYPNCFMLKRCNTPQCSEFRKERVLKEITKSIFYTYEWFQNKKVSK